MRCFGCTEFFWRLVGSSVVMVSNFDELYISSYTEQQIRDCTTHTLCLTDSPIIIQQYSKDTWWMCPKMGYTLLVHHVLLRRWSQRLKQNHATSSFLDRPHCHMIDCWWHFRSNAIKFLLDIRKITMKNPIDILFDGYPIGNRWHITI